MAVESLRYIYNCIDTLLITRDMKLKTKASKAEKQCM